MWLHAFMCEISFHILWHIPFKELNNTVHNLRRSKKKISVNVKCKITNVS